MEKFFNQLYNVLYYIVLFTSLFGFILFAFDAGGYKYITDENKWNRAEYIEQQVLLVLVSFLCTVALYISYKRNLNAVYKILYYFLFLLIIFLLFRGIFEWSNSGFDHTF